MSKNSIYAFDSNADSDPTSENNADPVPQPCYYT